MLILSLFILLSPIWLWLLLVLNISSSFSSITSVLDLCKRNWSPKGKLVVLAAVINSFNTIWFCRNQARFTDKRIHVRSAVNLIISITSLCGNHSKLAANSSISEFVLLKAFSIKTTYKNAPIIKEVLCHPPILNWVKCNIDGASLGNPGPSSCGDIFRNSNAEFLGPFAMNLGVSNSIYAKLHGAMIAIETSFNRGRKHLWLETDSMLVTHAFKSKLVVPWHLRNRKGRKRRMKEQPSTSEPSLPISDAVLQCTTAGSLRYRPPLHLCRLSPTPSSAAPPSALSGTV